MSQKIAVWLCAALLSILSLTLMLLLYLPANPVHAETAVSPIIISTTTDNLDGLDGQCSLREALHNANNNSQYSGEDSECTGGSAIEMDILRLQSGSTYTLTDSNGSLQIVDDLRIESADTSAATIQMTVAGERAVAIYDAHVEIDNLILSGGNIDGNGGGILNQGTLTLTQVSLQNNDARSGGALYNQGTAVVLDSTILSNTASINGGGIANDDGGKLTLRNTRIQLNTADQNGGGVYHAADQSSLTLTNSQIISNTATNGDGGGLCTLADSSISASQLQGNHAANSLGGGIYNGSAQLNGDNINLMANGALVGGGLYNANGTITLHSSIIADNEATTQGGGLYNDGFQARLELDQSSVDGNMAENGAGLYQTISAHTTIIQSAIVYNQATVMGGGILTEGNLTMGNVTISTNSAGGSGGGMAITADGSVTAVNSTLALNNSNLYQAGIFHLTNSIIAADSQPGCQFDNASIDSIGHNLTNDNSCGIAAPTDIFAAVLGLAPLDNYYSELPTHALLDNSPALDMADSISCDSYPVNGHDQRDYKRPFGLGCDVGAHEEQPASTIYLPTVIAQ